MFSYENVMNVKADVAAVFDYFFASCIDLRWVTWGAVKGAPERGRSSLTLDGCVGCGLLLQLIQ
jgi:hypothetical protein